mgnify:CR=1 FL=1
MRNYTKTALASAFRAYGWRLNGNYRFRRAEVSDGVSVREQQDRPGEYRVTWYVGTPDCRWDSMKVADVAECIELVNFARPAADAAFARDLAFCA